jgi:outer membrane receptor protein involved in Fe transport
LALSLGITAGIGAAVSKSSYAQDRDTSANIQEVIVTGSRVRRPESFDSAVPLAVIDGDALNASGFTVLGDALGNLPQGMVNSNLQNSSGTLFNAGQSRADLRGLGSARTLVLVDGRRHLTGDFRTSAVDLNMIPSTMIDRIDAISGGASAVYGSEAIAGVVNIILKKKMDGLTVDFQGGMTGEGDGDEWKVSAGYGMPFADDRGSFLIGGEFGKVDPILQVDRDWAFPGQRRNTLVSPNTVVPASRTNTMPTATFQLIGGTNPATARSVSVALDRSQINVNSTECRTATVRPLCQDPWLFYGATYNALQGSLERGTGRMYLDYDLTDNMTAFADVSYAKSQGDAIFQPAFSNAAGGGTMPIVMRGDNAYLNGSSALASQLRTQWAAAGLAFNQTTAVSVGKFWQEFGNRNTDVSRHSYRAISGLQGDFSLWSRDVTWDVSAQYSELEGFALAFNVPNILKTQQATDAILLNGAIVCRDAAARAAGCQPWDLINGPSQAAVDWANADARSDGKASQTVVAANVATTLLELPAGPLGMAIGMEYREEKSDQIQDALSASGALFYNAIGRTKGEYDITEAYAELVVPILADKFLAKQLSVEAAGRTGDYSTVGSVDQWRLQATWAPIQDVSFRASQSSAVRAPNITELFGPQARNFTTAANDPCDSAQVNAIANDPARRATRVANCAAAIPGYNPATFSSNFGSGRPSLALLQGGNPDLFEETADTMSAGVVLKPRWVDNLSFSFDYWKVEVEDAVNVIPINTLLTNLCYDVNQDPNTNPFCAFIQRDPTGAATGGLVGGVTQVVQTNQNVQSIETSGVDLALQYQYDFGAPGLFQFRADTTRVIRWDLQGVPGGPVTHYAGTLPGVNGSVPEWKANGTVGWSWREITVQVQSRFQDSYALSEVNPSSSLDPFYTGNYWEHDLRATYRWNDALTLRAGLINATDERPPAVPEAGSGTTANSSTYDNRGRWFYVGATYSFAPKR